jgi:hypothetical protein
MCETFGNYGHGGMTYISTGRRLTISLGEKSGRRDRSDPPSGYFRSEPHESRAVRVPSAGHVHLQVPSEDGTLLSGGPILHPKELGSCVLLARAHAAVGDGPAGPLDHRIRCASRRLQPCASSVGFSLRSQARPPSMGSCSARHIPSQVKQRRSCPEVLPTGGPSGGCRGLFSPSGSHWLPSGCTGSFMRPTSISFTL